jgi:2-polyprenyl-3-methyl-5-hydroxy-6-metoxy-1,4-benzoquinol methylase
MTELTSTDQIRRDFDRIATLPDSGFDHNARYHDVLLRSLPACFDRALDVGCGTGAFARLLAARAARVDAIDLSPAMIAAARDRSSTEANITFEVADVLAHPLGRERYAVIASIATLHHMPLEQVLPRLTEALAPGGTLVVLDLLDDGGLADLPRNAIAWVYARALSLAHGTRTPAAVHQAWREHGARERHGTWRDTTTAFRTLLPGAQLRRHLMWRYSAVWVKR